MAEFKARIVAELDTAELEQRLKKVLGKNYKLTIESEKAKEDINSIGNSITQTEKKASTFGLTLKNALHIGSAAALVAKEISLIRTAANKAVETVKNLNQSLTDLRIVTKKSNAEATKIMGSYNSMGQMLGATTSEIADSGIAWLRQGKSISEANNLIVESTKLAKIGMLDNADATKYLTSALNGYRLESEQASSVVDKLSKLDSAAAITAGGLAEGMSQTASTANDLGISIDRLIGYLSTIGSVTQGSMSSIGQALKTIFSRMSNVKLGKVEFTDDDGSTENLSDVETTLSKLGIKLRTSNNEFRDFGSVLDEVGSKWSNYSSVQQAAITKAFAGVRQGENFRVLMNNYEQAIKYMNLSADSAGAAEEKFSAYTDSIEAKSKTLQAAFEGLATNSISDDTVKNIISATTAMVKFVDETNLLKGVVTGGFAIGLIKGFTLLKTGISAASIKLNQFSAALKLVKSGNIGQAEIQQLANLTANLSQSQLKAVLSSKALSAEQRIAILTAQGMSQSEAQATLSTLGLATAEGTATGMTNTFSGALKGLWATIKANPIGVIFTAISAAVMVFQSYNDSVKQMQENAVNALNETNEHSELSGRTLKHHHQNISKALNDAVSEGYISVNPASNAKTVKEEQFNAEFLNESQIQELLSLLAESPIRIAVELCSIYGFRRSEVLGLKWHNVDFENESIRICETLQQSTKAITGSTNYTDGTKNRSSNGTMPMTKRAKTLLQEQRKRQLQNQQLLGDGYIVNDYVCTFDNGKEITPNYLSRTFHKVIVNSDLPQIRLHDLRHSAASNLLAQGFSVVQVADWLRHSNPATTLKFYAHVDKSSKMAIAKALD